MAGGTPAVRKSPRMRLVLERFAHNALALLAVTTILFFMFRLMPGTPLAAFINENLNADQQQAMLEQFGLDRPMWQQYFIYLGNLLQGEMGLSFFQRRPVLDHPARGPAELGDPDADVADHRLHLRRAGRRLARLEARQLDRARRGAGRAGDARRARVLDRHGAAGAAVVQRRLVPVRRRQQPGPGLHQQLAAHRLVGLPPPSRLAGPDARPLPAGPAACC